MHISRLSLRLVALLAVVVGAMLAFNSLPPAGAPKASAAGPWVGLIGTSCADIYFDLDPKQVKGAPPDLVDPDGAGPGQADILIGQSLTRTEPSQRVSPPAGPNDFDVVTETYLGPDKKAGADPLTFAQLPAQMQNTINIAITLGVLPASFRQTAVDLVPDQSSTTTDCKMKQAAVASPEMGQMNSQTKFAAVGNKRPHATGTVYTSNAEQGFKCQPKGLAGPFDDDGDTVIDDGCPGGPAAFGPVINSFQFSTCTFSEAARVWVRTDVQTIVPPAAKAPSIPGTQTFGHATLWYGAGSPTIANDPLSCSIAAALPFPAVIKSESRVARTDFTTTKNTALTIPLDTNGPNPNPPKFTPQVSDTGDGVADDWDGDGCPDWDELDKDFTNGRDPFNPNDCGTNPNTGLPDEHNYNGVFNILATAFPAAKKGTVGAIKSNIVSIDVLNTKAGKQTDAVLTVPDGTVKRNQKVFWDTDTAGFAQWWQVKRIITVVGVNDQIEINRLFAPPCGTANNGIPVVPAPAPGALRSINCTGASAGGNYFHCISRVTDTKLPVPPAVRPLASRLVCYIDAPALASGSAVPSRADGNAGAPPPPPYSTAKPTSLSGSFDPLTQQILFSGCFENTGTPTGPNIITEAHIDAKTMKGFALLYFAQSIANCTAVTPSGPATLQIAVTLSEQNDSFDHDRDGCTDADELASPAVGKCGDDPYNPYDSDSNASSDAAALVTVTRTDVGTPGFYFHCIAHVDQAKSGAIQDPLTTRLQCYTDSTVFTVNPPAVPSPNTNAATCPPAPAAQCGDGQPGTPPPLAFADIDLAHIVFSGAGNFYDSSDNTIHLEGCFTGVDNSIQGPNIYTRVVIAAHNGALVGNGLPAVAMNSGQGLADIWPGQSGATCAGAVGAPPIDDAPIEFAENFSTKGPNPPPETGAACSGNTDSDGDGVIDDGCPEFHFDTDLDGCTDTQELRNTQVTGGLRDPYNRWDLDDQWIGGAKDRVISGGDIGAVVARFGSVGSPTGDPLVAPTLSTGYHVAADRGGSLPGSNTWNLRPPDGSISGGDIGAVVAQFGHGCST